MPKIVVLLGLLLNLSAVPGRAQDATAPLLTLEQAIALAEGHNRLLAAADARIDAADAGIDEARSLRLPRIDLYGGLHRTDNPAAVFSNLLGQESFAAENFELESLNRPDPLNNWQAGVSLQQPLWTGGRLSGSLTAATRQREAAASGRDRVRQQVILQVTERYASAVLAALELAVASEAVATAAAHVALISDLWRGGLVVESDLLQARVRESEVREMLIRAEGGVEITRAALNLALGRGLDTPFTLPETLELGDGDDQLSRRFEQAEAQRPDLRAARQHLAAAEARIRIEQAGRRPQIDLQAAYEANAEDFFGRDGDNWGLGVGIRLPLFDGNGTRARVKNARAQAREAREQAEQLRQEVALEVRRAALELGAARQRLQQSVKAAELARRSLTIVADRYKEGLTTLPELLDSEAALTEARRREVAARRDLLLAGANLDLAAGAL